MFRVFLLSAMLLGGCTAKEKTAPRIVKIFQFMPKTSDTIIDGCEWKVATISIFYQRKQTISFKYNQCENSPRIKFSIKQGRDIYVEASVDHQGVQITKEEVHILSVWKSAPLKDEEFVQSIISDKPEILARCGVFKGAKIWKIGVIKPESTDKKGWVMYPPLSDSVPMFHDTKKQCGPFSYSLENDWSIGILDGIAIAFKEDFSLFGFYDVASITYENRG